MTLTMEGSPMREKSLEWLYAGIESVKALIGILEQQEKLTSGTLEYANEVLEIMEYLTDVVTKEDSE